MNRATFLAAIVLAVSAAACGDDTPATPTPTTPLTVTDTFAGTLNPNGAASYSFTTAASGNVTATLATLGPDSTLIVGLSLGTWNGTSCQIVLANDKATQASVIVGAASGAGNLCVRVYDVGNVVSPATYEVQVNHP
jgi:hypothetical protein